MMRAFLLIFLLGLSWPSLTLAETAAERSVLMVRKGAAALLRGKYDSAISAYDQALKYEKLAPSRKANILSDRGVAYWRLTKPAEAMSDFQKAVETDPQYPQAYNNMGNLLVEMNRHKEAIEAFSKAIEIAPTYGVAYNNRGSAYYELGDVDDAIKDFSAAIRHLALNAVPHNGRGRAFLAKNENYAALRDFSRAIKLNNSYGMVYLSRARAYENVDDHRDAIKDYTHAISLAREEPVLYLERGRAYQAVNDFGPAISDYSKVIELAPGNAEAFALRGLSFAFAKNYEKALADVDKAIELDPTSLLGYLTRAKVLKRKGDYDKALEDLKTVLEIGKEHAEALKLIGQIHEIRNEKDEAVTYYQRSLASDPFMDGSREGMKRITGQLPSYAREPIGEPVSGWTLSQLADGRYYVSNDNYPYFHGIIETYGRGVPKLVEWSPMTGTWKGVGILRYTAGTVGEDDNAVPLEYAAIIDLKKAEIAAIEPYRWGEREAKWKWGNGSVLVTDPDGMISEVSLRQPTRVSQRGDQGLAYAPSPWGEIWQPTRRGSPPKRVRSKPEKPKPRRQPKSILDWLFE